MTDLTVQDSPSRGRGVFAARSFDRGETIEVCPVIVLSEADAARLDDTHLYNYYFGWGPDGREAAIALGFGSLYNHADDPNAVYQKDQASGTIRFSALRAITVGEEIFVRYNYPSTREDGRLWFDIR